jgi:SanA protein
MKKYLFSFLSGLVLCAALVSWADHRVGKIAEDYVQDNPEKLPPVKTALLLGTSRLLSDGRLNAYFYNRTEAALQLYRSGRIRYVLISGDNSRKGYNEPQDMKDELVSKGIPDTAIYLDFAGFRTYDSVVRAWKIFDQERFIVVSQEFHNERAVFIARSLGLEAYGYNAQDVSAYMGFKTNMRELLARVKVFLDLLWGQEPHFLGEKIPIGTAG